MESTEPQPEVIGDNEAQEEVKEEAKEVTTGEMSLKRTKIGEDDGKEITMKSVKVKPNISGDNEDDPDKKKFPKKKIAMVVGYNGANYSGSQRNDAVETIEGDLEKALYEAGMIDFRNLGDLKKIRWTRATRTDKKVHALQNYFSARLLLDPSKSLEEYVELVNSKLPSEIRLFCFLNVLGGFDAKHAASHREYDYYLPTFMISPSVKLDYDIVDKSELLANEENKEDMQKEYDKDDAAGYNPLNRNRARINRECLDEVYGYRITDDLKEKLSRLLAKFEGTHRYHNYTKQMKAKDKNSQRYMMEVKVKDYMVYDGIEFARVYLKGQAFLYNQIRKMIGAIFMIMRFELPESFLDHSLKDNQMTVPTAPGEGLMLNKVAFDIYNRSKRELREKIQPWESKLDEIEQFRIDLVNYI